MNRIIFTCLLSIIVSTRILSQLSESPQKEMKISFLRHKFPTSAHTHHINYHHFLFCFRFSILDYNCNESSVFHVLSFISLVRRLSLGIAHEICSLSSPLTPRHFGTIVATVRLLTPTSISDNRKRTEVGKMNLLVDTIPTRLSSHPSEESLVTASQDGSHESDIADSVILEIPRPVFVKSYSFASLPDSHVSVESQDLEKTKFSKSPSTSRSTTPRPLNDSAQALFQPESGEKQYSSFRKARDLTWHRFFILYRAICFFVVLFNVLALLLLVTMKPVDHDQAYYRQWIPVCASVNIMIGTLSRNEFFVNCIFKIMLLVPLTWPLRIRSWFAQVYHYGGLHSGCHTAGTIWIIAITTMN